LIFYSFITVYIGATTVGTGVNWSHQLLGWGPTMYWSWSPYFLAVVFKKEEISQQLVSIFKNFPEMIPPDPHSRRGWPLLHPTPAQPLTGRDPTLVPLNCPAMVVPLTVYKAWTEHSSVTPFNVAYLHQPNLTFRLYTALCVYHCSTFMWMDDFIAALDWKGFFGKNDTFMSRFWHAAVLI